MKKRSVIYDASPFMANIKTGVGYYVENMILSLYSFHKDDIDIRGYYFNFLNRKKIKIPKSLKLHVIKFIPGKLLSISRKLGFQLFLEFFVWDKSKNIIFTNYVSIPQLLKRNTILIIYDLCFLDYPEYVEEKNLNFLLKYCPASIYKADKIITISKFTKERIRHHFPGLKSDIIVTPIPPRYDLKGDGMLSKHLKNLGIVEQKYVLYIGTIEPRKNIVNIVRAWAMIQDTFNDDYSIVIAGGKGWKDELILSEINRLKTSGIRIIQTGYVSDSEKKALYMNTSCFIMASHYEGFGMPILEAMSYGAPIAVSNLPVFHEVGGSAVLYFDKDNVSDISDKIKTLISSVKIKEDLKLQYTDQLSHFSWEANSDKINSIMV